MLKNTNKNFGRLVLLFMIVGTALIMKAQVLTSSSLSSLKTSMSESQKESDYILLPHPKFNIPLKLVIASQDGLRQGCERYHLGHSSSQRAIFASLSDPMEIILL
jgi:hypothetical protein